MPSLLDYIKNLRTSPAPEQIPETDQPLLPLHELLEHPFPHASFLQTLDTWISTIADSHNPQAALNRLLAVLAHSSTHYSLNLVDDNTFHYNIRYPIKIVGLYLHSKTAPLYASVLNTAIALPPFLQYDTDPDWAIAYQLQPLYPWEKLLPIRDTLWLFPYWQKHRADHSPRADNCIPQTTALAELPSSRGFSIVGKKTIAHCTLQLHPPSNPSSIRTTRPPLPFEIEPLPTLPFLPFSVSTAPLLLQPALKPTPHEQPSYLPLVPSELATFLKTAHLYPLTDPLHPSLIESLTALKIHYTLTASPPPHTHPFHLHIHLQAPFPLATHLPFFQYQLSVEYASNTNPADISSSLTQQFHHFLFAYATMAASSETLKPFCLHYILPPPPSNTTFSSSSRYILHHYTPRSIFLDLCLCWQHEPAPTPSLTLTLQTPSASHTLTIPPLNSSSDTPSPLLQTTNFLHNHITNALTLHYNNLLSC